MNCDLVLGIDWLCKHNPKINWESNNIQFTCCWSVHDELKFGDTQPSNLVIPIQMGDANLEMPTFDNSIDVAMLSENEFFSQGRITAFGLINFIPDYINVGALLSKVIPDNSILVPEAIEKIKSKVLAKYHGYINVFVDREATTLPPHHNQDIKIKLEEGEVLPFS